MADLLPFRPDATKHVSTEPVVFDLASDHADRVFRSLSSEMARRILQALYEEPCVASDLATELDTSLQNVDYHLGNLQEAELVNVVDTWYSQTGNEMKVYAPAARALMISSDPDDTSRLRSVASTLVASVLLLGAAAAIFRSVIVDRLVSPETIGGDSPVASVDAVGTEIDPLAHLPAVLDPGIVFLLGGLVGIVALGALLLASWGVGPYNR